MRHCVALQPIVGAENREREETRQRRHRFLRLVPACDVASIALRQKFLQPVGADPEVDRIDKIRLQQLARLGCNPQRIDSPARRHERMVARRTQPFEIAALADVCIAVRVFVDAVVTVESRAFVDDCIALLLEPRTVAPVEPLLP